MGVLSGEGTPATVWINLYRPLVGACGSVWATRDLADQFAGPGRLACVQIQIGVSLGATLLETAGEIIE